MAMMMMKRDCVYKSKYFHMDFFRELPPACNTNFLHGMGSIETSHHTFYSESETNAFGYNSASSSSLFCGNRSSAEGRANTHTEVLFVFALSIQFLVPIHTAVLLALRKSNSARLCSEYTRRPAGVKCVMRMPICKGRVELLQLLLLLWQLLLLQSLFHL